VGELCAPATVRSVELPQVSSAEITSGDSSFALIPWSCPQSPAVICLHFKCTLFSLGLCKWREVFFSVWNSTMREKFVGRCDVLLFRRRKFCQTCYASRPFRRKSAEPFRQLATINRTKETSKLGSRRRAALSVLQSAERTALRPKLDSLGIWLLFWRLSALNNASENRCSCEAFLLLRCWFTACRFGHQQLRATLTF
jgi:hypothetical protein